MFTPTDVHLFTASFAVGAVTGGAIAGIIAGGLAYARGYRNGELAGAWAKAFRGENLHFIAREEWPAGKPSVLEFGERKIITERTEVQEAR